MGVLVSGDGTNLRALLEESRKPDYPARVAAVASNRPRCRALEVARAEGISTAAFPLCEFGGEPLRRDASLAAWLGWQEAEILVLAGYDRIVTAPLLDRFPGRILNLHNSLLPAFSGTMRAVELALEHGVKITGCTVHIVDPDLVDGGPIVNQAAVVVEEDDDPASLRQRIHREEWRILPEAVALLARGELRLEGRRVRRRAPSG